MSDPTGNALRSAQSSGGEFFEDIDACAESPEMEEQSILSVTVEFANRLRTESRAREARLLALVQKFERKAEMFDGEGWEVSMTYRECAKELVAALRGDA